MREEIFTVFDTAAKRFLQPFFADTVEVACRMFRELVNKEGHQFNKYPEDYVLFHLGTYDGENGSLNSFPEPHSLGVAITYVQRSPIQAVQ